MGILGFSDSTLPSPEHTLCIYCKEWMRKEVSNFPCCFFKKSCLMQIEGLSSLEAKLCSSESTQYAPDGFSVFILL